MKTRKYVCGVILFDGTRETTARHSRKRDHARMVKMLSRIASTHPEDVVSVWEEVAQ